MCSMMTRVLLLSAFFSVGASSGNNEQWKKISKKTDSRVQEDYHHGSHDFDMENEEDQLNRENYFQEIYMLQSAPKLIEFGHVCENPDSWEQRYEKKDFDQNRHQGKMLWADKTGSHGEHYWDYNHSGRNGDSEEESQKTDEEKPQMIFKTENPIKQNKKRQLIPERKEPRTPESIASHSQKEADEFLENSRREIEAFFYLESQNKKIFSNWKPSTPHFNNNFPFKLNLKNSRASTEGHLSNK